MGRVVRLVRNDRRGGWGASCVHFGRTGGVGELLRVLWIVKALPSRYACEPMRIVDSSSLVLGVLLALILGGAVGYIATQAFGALGWGLGVGVAVIVVLFNGRGMFRRWRIAGQAFPAEWRHWLVEHVPWYSALDEAGRRRFERDVLFFLDERSLEGIDGVEVDEDLCLSVAAGAALLLNGRPDWELNGAGRSVLFYPGAFDEAYHGGDYAAFDGMAHEQGPLLLSAQAVRASWADPADGQNVVLHELAHLFDFQNAGADGVPSLMAPSSEASWRALVREETERIRRGRSMLRGYAATAPSEFFAVSVEVFFERPVEMRRRHAALYEALRQFFNLDPAERVGEQKSGGETKEQRTKEGFRSTVKKTGGDITRPPGN